MQDLKVTGIQTKIYWEDKPRNLESLESVLDNIQLPTDLIVLPEMFTTGFTMNSQALAEDMSGPTVEWLARQAKLRNAVIAGNAVIDDQGRYYNRLIWMSPDGSCQHYDKRHLFEMAEEHQHYSPGNERLTVSVKGWDICPQICYDLRFPVWNRNIGDYDLLIFIANWPEKRNFAWKHLLHARAIENQSYVLGVNRVGIDGKDIYYSGDSALIDPLGEAIISSSDEELIMSATLSVERLKYVREKLPFQQDADSFTIK